MPDEWVIARNDRTGEMEGYFVFSNHHDENHPILVEGDVMPSANTEAEWKIIQVFSEGMNALLIALNMLEIAMLTGDSVVSDLINETIQGTQKGFR